jgi:hypothetical protein
MGSLFGVTGQAGYDQVVSWRQKRMATEAKPSSLKLKDVLDSKWSPVKLLSSEDYKKILSEKLLAVDAEIALIDEEMASLRANKLDTQAPNETNTNST